MQTKMYDLFLDIIGRHLDNRDNYLGNSKIWLENMYIDLSKNIPNSTVEDIKKLDLYNAGHIDYHHKFALGCDELYQRNTQ